MAVTACILPEVRRPALKHALRRGVRIRAIESHNGLSALIASSACDIRRQRAFDALWVSSLTCSAAQGLPDIEAHILERRLGLVHEIAAASDRPLIVDADTGGDCEALPFVIRNLEAMGVSIMVIEDKLFPKRNSLLQVAHELESPEVFAAKVDLACRSRGTRDMLIFARIESLNAGETVADALHRARAYAEAGADGIMIHSRMAAPDEVLEFFSGYKALDWRGKKEPYLMCVPTTYHRITAEALFEKGANVVIYANHLLRAAHLAMEAACQELLLHDRGLEVERFCCSLDSLFATLDRRLRLEEGREHSI